MIVDALVQAAEALRDFGAYMIAAVVVYGYWKREQYVKELHRQNLELSKEQIEASADMRHAVETLGSTLSDLKVLIQTLVNRK